MENQAIESLKKRVARRVEEATTPTGQINGKICPFMSTADRQVACNPQCQLYKEDGSGKYACPIQELNVISYQAKRLASRGASR